MAGALLWDFDGTLARREGVWSGALLQALDELEPGHGLGRDDIHPRIVSGFPWHHPEQPHPHLCRADRWWAHLGAHLERVFQDLGFSRERAAVLARATRAAYTDVTSFRLYDDTIPVVEKLRGEGWRHLILSNHVPELTDIVRGLGLLPLFDAVLSSALTGYEKPHPEAFRLGLEAARHPDEVWMIGDNPVADVWGAEAVGIPAILVRQEGDARRQCRDLWGVVEIIG